MLLSLRHRLPTLHTRIGVALGGLILVLTLALAAVMSRSAEEQVLRQSAFNLESLSRQMSRELSGGMDRFAQAVVTQTDRDRFRNPEASAPSMRAALEQFQRVNPEFAYVSIVDVASARVEAATGGIFEGGDGRGRPVYERGRLGLFVGDVHDAVRLAELLPKPVNGESLRFLDVAAPIADASGRVFRVLATHVAWQWTDTIRREVFGPLREKSGVDAFLLDTAGKVVLAATPSMKVGTDLSAVARLSGQAASVAPWPDGGDFLTVVTDTAPHGHFPGFGWKVVARQPVALAAAAASSLRTAFLVAGLALGLGGAVIAWFVTGRLVRPVRLLAAAAASARAGDTRAAGPRQAGDEVSAVHDAIFELADTARSQTEARKLSQRQFAVLADSLPQVVFQTDAHGVVEYINKDWLGAAAAAAGPLTLQALEHRLVAEDGECFFAAWRESLATGADLSVRCRLRASSAEAARWCDIEARAVRGDDGLRSQWVGTIFDVHAVVMHAEDVQRALDAERTARLDAERLARMRDEFLATVSHELRSPLSVITGWSDILRRKGSDNPMVARAADVIRINARLQAGLINDLLDITAVMAGKLVLNLEPIDLARCAGEAVLAQLHAAQTKGVALVCQADVPRVVRADRRRVAQILSNLIGNAIKFTDAGGEIVVTVASDGRSATLCVSDSGCGIDADFLPHVFERMRQADSSTTRRAGGLGLGLAIVEGLVTLHEGTVTAHSAGKGLGSRFTVEIPMRAGTQGHAAPRPDADDEVEETVVELQGRRILLVDDEADAREVAHVALSSLGADVRVASSGAEVLKILERERFDALVSDIGMPGMDGLTLLRTLRALPHGSSADLPAVALTAFAMESDRRAGMQAGFQAYVAKPISLRRLSEAVAAAMAVRQVT